MTTQAQKCARFADLHNGNDAFIIPNPWDVGSAKLLEGAGFKALATTSAGLAYALGCSDGEISLDEKIAHCRALASATSIPINADFENGFADSTSELKENIQRLAASGIAGCSIEDYDRDRHVIYDFNLAVDRMHAAVEATDSLGIPFQLTGRAENLLRGNDDLDDTIARLQAYSAAGAHVLYAPGLKSLEQIAKVTAAVDKPINVLAVFFRGLKLADFAGAGVNRLSVGSALTWASVNPLLSAAKAMLEDGSFDWTAGMASGAEVNELMARAKT